MIPKLRCSFKNKDNDLNVLQDKLYVLDVKRYNESRCQFYGVFSTTIAARKKR